MMFEKHIFVAKKEECSALHVSYVKYGAPKAVSSYEK
jgi:hypothetical protein